MKLLALLSCLLPLLASLQLPFTLHPWQFPVRLVGRRDVEEEWTKMTKVESDEPWTRDVLVLWPKEDHIVRANKRDAERRLKEDHMIWVNKKDEDLRMLASRIGK